MTEKGRPFLELNDMSNGHGNPMQIKLNTSAERVQALLREKMIRGSPALIPVMNCSMEKGKG